MGKKNKKGGRRGGLKPYEKKFSKASLKKKKTIEDNFFYVGVSI